MTEPQMKERTKLELRTLPDPILRQVCERVEDFSDQAYLNDIIQQMGAICSDGGIGLGANQAGCTLRIIVLMVPGFPRMSMINPEILSAKGTQDGIEGCLSCPGEKRRVVRALKIKVRYQILDGSACEAKFSHQFARVIQHEIDHLNGILIVDKR